MNKQASLTPQVKHILRDKGTEHPGSGKYNEHDVQGTYLCRQCGMSLFRSSSKFTAGCGWPSFDDEIEDTIKRLPDPDGRRTEILCSRCDGHLGHVFTGENLTKKNLRHCVNALSLDFTTDLKVQDTEEAIIAGGCFWGVEYYMQQHPGVCSVESGYIGGHKNNPTYQDVCSGNSGHIEAVRVVFDTERTTFENIIQLFLEIHDPTQTDGQGPDIGEQYLSAIFYYNNDQKLTAQQNLDFLESQGLEIATKLLPITTFWPAEAYHQNYYTRQKSSPYCHHRVKRFK